MVSLEYLHGSIHPTLVPNAAPDPNPLKRLLGHVQILQHVHASSAAAAAENALRRVTWIIENGKFLFEPHIMLDRKRVACAERPVP